MKTTLLTIVALLFPLFLYAAAPTCSTLTPQTFLVGQPANIVDPGCVPGDGGMTLTYAWTQTITSNPATINNPTTATPNLTGQTRGPIDLQLIVTNGSSQTTTYVVHDGVVVVDSFGNVVTGDAFVDAILEPTVPYGQNPYPFEDSSTTALLNVQSPAWNTNFPDFWDTPAAGTASISPTATCGFSVTPGTCLTGTGTHFLTDVNFNTTTLNGAIDNMQTNITVSNGALIGNGVYIRVGSEQLLVVSGGGTANLTVTRGALGTTAVSHSNGATVFAVGTMTAATQYMVVWWNSNQNRRLHSVLGVVDDTHLIMVEAWDTATTETGTNYNFASTTAITNWATAMNPFPGNYYDGCEAFYIQYYRSGMDTWLDHGAVIDAHKCIDLWFDLPQNDKGTSYELSIQSLWQYDGRSMSITGLLLRAHEQGPSSPIWAGLRDIWAFSIATLNVFNTRGGWFVANQFDTAYFELFVAYCAEFDPDSTQVSTCQAALTSMYPGGSLNVWGTGVSARGDFPTLELTNQTIGGSNLVTVSHGVTSISCGSCSWSGSTFTPFNPTGGYGNQGSGLLLYPQTGGMCVIPSTNAGFDTVVYWPTVTSSTMATLDQAYQGASGSYCYTTGNGFSALGWQSQPFMEGILIQTFVHQARALATSDPTNSALAWSYAVGLANWAKTYAYSDPAHGGVGGVYYYAGAVNCAYPVQTSYCTLNLTAPVARRDMAQVVRGVSMVYAHNLDASLAAWIRMVYGQMWCSSFMSGAPCSTGFDGSYLSDMAPGGSFQNTANTSNIWIGVFSGIDNAASPPAILNAAGQTSNSPTSITGGVHMSGSVIFH